MVDLIAQGLASGVVVGLVYTLIALSVVVIYKATDVVNFAGGEMVMLGGYLALLAIVGFGWSYLAAFVFAAGTTFALGALFDCLVLDKAMRRATPGQGVMVSMVIATVGLAYLIKGLVRVVPQTEEAQRLPSLFVGDPIVLGPAILQRQDIGIAAVSVLIILAVGAFFRYTLPGKALLAMAENPRAAVLIGIPVRKMRWMVWGCACMLAALAGVLLAPKLLLTPDMGGIVIMAFAAAILGGFANLPGCIVGGVILGVGQNMVGLFISSKAIAVAPFVAIMLVLVLKPEGLFGGKPHVKKV